MASLNINQLTSHIDDLRILLANNDIDIISINETKLNESILDHEVHIPGCWDNVYKSSNPNEMWEQWKCTFLAIADKHAPLKMMRIRSQSSPWITSELKDLMHNRDILKIKASKTNDPTDWALFKKQRNIVNKQIRSAKQVYYLNSFNMHTSNC